MPDANKQEKLAPRDFVATSVWVNKLFFRIAPFWYVVKIVSYVIRGLQPVIYGYIFARVIDGLVSLYTNSASTLTDTIPFLGLFFGYTLFTTVLDYFTAYANRFIRITSRTRIEVILSEQINRLGIQTLEQPEVQNLLSRTNDNMGNLSGFFDMVMMFITNLVTVVSSGFVISIISPWLIPLQIIIVIPRLLTNRYFSAKFWKFEKDNTELRRRTWAISHSLSEPKELKEVSLSGGFEYLKEKFETALTGLDKQIIKLRMRWTTFDSFWGLVSNLGVYIGYLLIFAKLLAHEISIGDVTFQMRALGNFSGALDAAGSQLSDLEESAFRLKEVRKFLTMSPLVEDGKLSLDNNTTAPEIEFEDVSFAYPGSEKLIFKNLNLHIAPGEKVAIVGHNGAGKTTLVKMISRIYQVKSGRILINGLNINSLKISDWHKQTGFLFQDFNAYEYLDVKENIYMGRPNGELNVDAIQTAAKQADADGFVQEFKHKYDTVLSERFKDGIRPSGGMWQKIAIARFFYRNAPLVIFDEPTAAIDAVSEYKIFNRIYKFFKNKTVIIISHRFSTVRNADRIIVVDKGRIVETGTHEELIAMDGNYAHAFKLQAEGYKV